MPHIATDLPEKKGATNPLDKKEEEKKLISEIYDDKDREYITFLQDRLMGAKLQKSQPYPEFNNKTYYQYYEDNEKIANTHHLDPKKNDDDVVVSAGTIEQKLDALLANINNLNLEPEVMAFDAENNKIHALGVALEDIIHDTEIRDGGDGAGDEEKKVQRQRELLKQGTVFVQEEWLRKFETKKVLREKNYGGEFKDFKGYDEKLELVFEGPSRNLLYGPNVYLGKITEFYNENQPYIFYSYTQSHKTLESRFSKFENWKYVKQGALPSSETKTIFENKWRLNEIKGDLDEVIIYQDKPRDEFQIIINGVLMLPIGFPLSAVSPGGEYNIVKQIYRIINNEFAYGKSFVSSGSIKEVSNLIDEMLKLFVLKTRKSFTPSYVNTSGRVIDKKVLSPGRISMGFDPDALKRIDSNEVQGVTTGEVAVLKEMQDLIDKSTVSDQFSGQQGKSGTTATEVVEMQRQARLTLGLTMTVCALLEKKLAYLRLWNILENWFEPIDSRIIDVESAREMIDPNQDSTETPTEKKQINVYRKTNRETNIDGAGIGERMIVPQDGDIPSSDVIREMERQDEKEKGFPIRKIFINPSGLRNAKITWYVVINPKEKESSPFLKMLFREQLTDILTMIQLGSVPNLNGIEEEFSRVWGKSRSKLFQKGPVAPDMAGAMANGQMAGMPNGSSAVRGRPNPAGVPQMPGGGGMAATA